MSARARLGTQATWSPDAGFFVNGRGGLLTEDAYRIWLKKALTRAGLVDAAGAPLSFNTHSARIGMASCAVAAGVSEKLVMQAGEWSTPPASLGYVRTTAEGLLHTQRVVNAAPSPVFIQPMGLAGQRVASNSVSQQGEPDPSSVSRNKRMKK